MKLPSPVADLQNQLAPNQAEAIPAILKGTQVALSQQLQQSQQMDD